MESVVEMRVLTNGYQAEYGRQSGGTINLITRGGGRDFHGSGHFDHRHEDLNANTFFNNRQGLPRPLYRYMIAGYSIGGPAYIPHQLNADRRRLFFFVSQEFTQIAQPTVNVTANEPTAAERLGDFSNSRNSAGAVIPIINPANGAPFPGNKVPGNLIDPIGSAMLNLLPLPNGYVNPAPGQQYTANFLAGQAPPYNRRNTMLRFDGSITSKVNMYYRYGGDVDNQYYPFVVAPGVGTNVRFLPGYIHGVHLTYTATPKLVNELLFGNGHDNYGFYHTTADSQWFRTSSLNPPTLRPFPTGSLRELPALRHFSGGSLIRALTPGGQQSPGPALLTHPTRISTTTMYSRRPDQNRRAHSIKAGVSYNLTLRSSLGRAQ
jgi:hypothetical protein